MASDPIISTDDERTVKMRPVKVSIDVLHAREQVYDFLDVIANHEPFTNHMMHDWEYSGPDRGVGSEARS